MTDVIVERTLPTPVSEFEKCHVLAELGMCIDFYNVRLVESFLSERGNRMICHFKAPDAESVRQVFRGAGVHIDRVWTARVVKRRSDR